jgi:imidazolonepropionase-like amidohydrolase
VTKNRTDAHACLFVLAAFLLAPAVQAEVIVIENATVLTISHGTFRGSVLVRDGKIAEVAEKVMIPQGATVIDASGQYVMPGIIDCHSHIAVDGNVNEGSVAVSSMVNIKDVIDPEDVAIYRALAGGVTSANILHGSANPIGGQTLVLKMRWGKSAQDLVFEGATPGIKFALGENPKRPGNPAGRGNQATATARYPATRLGVEDTIRTAMTEAKQYKASWDAYQAQIARGETALPPRIDLRLEPLKEVLEGKRFVHAHSYRADEILMLLRVADEFGFKIRTLQHGLEAYKVAKEIAAHGASVSTFSDWWAYKVEAIDAIPYNAAILQKKGVLVSLNSDDEELMRRLNTEASKVLKYGGLTENEALAMITLNPAKQLGIDSRVGSIDTGKDADLVLYDKDPLSQFAKVQKVLIDGAIYFDRDKEVSGRPAKETEKNKLIEKEKQNQPAAAPPPTGTARKAL